MGDLIDLVVAVDGILQTQARADASYFDSIAGGRYTDTQRRAVAEGILKAYRWQYIVSGVTEGALSEGALRRARRKQTARITAALQPLLYAMPAAPRH